MKNTPALKKGKWKTRIAPTPSGFLHLGNLYSFSLTAAIAKVAAADVLLRIDDLDSDRVREIYVRDIFDTLSFMGIQWQQGPRSVEEFTSVFSQQLRKPLYDKALARLAASGEVYACTCSRAELARAGAMGYPGTCRTKNIPLDSKNACWRIRTNGVSVVLETPSGPLQTKLPVQMNDFVVKKKDGSAAYQLSSLIDDVHFGINLVIRGEDLFPSTIAQLYLSSVLKMEQFRKTVFYHHQLLNSPGGGKLSKSAGDTSIRYLRQHGKSAAEVYKMMGAYLGMNTIHDWRDLCDIASGILHQKMAENRDCSK